MSERNLFLSHQVETNPKVKKPEYSETVKQHLSLTNKHSLTAPASDLMTEEIVEKNKRETFSWNSKCIYNRGKKEHVKQVSVSTLKFSTDFLFASFALQS